MKAFAEKLEELLEIGGTKKDIAFIVIAAIALVISIFDIGHLPVDAAWIAIILCGIPIICGAFIGLVTEFDIKADVLVSIALVASVIIGEYFAAGEVAVIMQLGALLEDLTVAKARSGIEKLVELTPRTARIVRGSEEEVVPAENVQVDDIVRVLPGETIPVDGIITAGQTSIDQSVMTGESLPVDKTEGDEVRSGTVNRFGAFDMRATKVGEDSSLARMVRLVQSADAGKAKIVRIADRWATWIVVIALSAAVLTWLFTGEIIRAVTILVVFCPCALVLATPTAIMAAIGNVTKYGVLVREGDALERLAAVKRVMFDKTGTLTHGTPKLVGAEAGSGSAAVPAVSATAAGATATATDATKAADAATAVTATADAATAAAADAASADVETVPTDAATERLLTFAAAAEARSEHPLGKAIVAGYRERFDAPLPELQDFTMTPGRGVAATVEGKRVLVGNAEMMEEEGVTGYTTGTHEAHLERGCTVSFVAVDGQPLGFIALADTMRETAKTTIAAIESLGVKTTMATGDGEKAARYIAAQTGVNDVRANCFPEDKMAAIEQYESAGEPVCMVGDGINDAPALKRSTVGVAMGGVGSDIAIDAADIVLVRDGIDSLPHVLALARRMMITIKCNLTFSLTLNFIAIILAITGVMGPVVGALVHNAGSVLVILNSAWLLKWRSKHVD